MLCCGCGGRGAGAGAFPPDQPKSNKDTTARQLSWAQVEAMTGGFTSAVVGEGGFSTVYLARLAGSLAAVKVHRSSERLHRAFRQELHALLHVRHPHIVRLLGFCDQRDEGGVLVLEFAPNGNLHERLHGKGGVALPWARRVSVVVYMLLVPAPAARIYLSANV